MHSASWKSFSLQECAEKATRWLKKKKKKYVYSKYNREWLLPTCWAHHPRHTTRAVLATFWFHSEKKLGISCGHFLVNILLCSLTHTDIRSATETHQTPIPWHFYCPAWGMSCSSGFIQGGWVFSPWTCKGRGLSKKSNLQTRWVPELSHSTSGITVKRNWVYHAVIFWWIFYRSTCRMVPTQKRLNRCFLYLKNLLGLVGMLWSTIRPYIHILYKSTSYSLSF